MNYYNDPKRLRSQCETVEGLGIFLVAIFIIVIARLFWQGTGDMRAGMCLGFVAGIVAYRIYDAVQRMIMRQKLRDSLAEFLKGQKK